MKRTRAVSNKIWIIPRNVEAKKPKHSISSITTELNEYRVNVEAITMAFNRMKLDLTKTACLPLLYKMAERKQTWTDLLNEVDVAELNLSYTFTSSVVYITSV